MYLHGTSRMNQQGHLEIGGCDTVELARQFGTPLYIFDEALIRNTIREYRDAFEKSGLSFQVAYASKAFCTMAMCRLVAEEGCSLDVVSSGELYTALKADFPVKRIHFHGNNKTPEEILFALDSGIGAFVVDNFYEISLLEALAKEKGVDAKVLLRVTPGVEAHTHEYISTGQQDSKFGFDMESGLAKEAIHRVLSTERLHLTGLHSHIGSQIFETEGFTIAIQRVADLYEWAVREAGASLHILNVGGGFGIRYTDEDTPLPPGKYIEAISDAVKSEFALRSLPFPEVIIEPGRSIVGPAGTTLYTIGSVKEIPGVRKYVAVNGGMTDNPRPALYQSVYEACVVNRAQEDPQEVVSIAGKCCESGDMLIWDISLPAVQPGDLLAVSCTGAYNYSMANNYNRIPRPAVVFVRNGEAELVVKRETLEDLVKNDVIPSWMKADTKTQV